MFNKISFIEVILRNNERVYLNVVHIIFVTESKRGCVIFDVAGNDYVTNESYSDIAFRIRAALSC